MNENDNYPDWITSFAVFLVATVGTALIYGCLAFISWNIHPAAWGEFTRLVGVAAEGVFLVMLLDAASDAE